MVETGEWITPPDLIKYLVSVQSTLQKIEIEGLRLTPAFPEEVITEQNQNQDRTPMKVPRLKASELYEPLDVFRSLGLPIIDWRGKDGKHKWRSSSEEGTRTNMARVFCTLMSPFPAEFLFDLGLRQHPPTGIILGIAAGDEPQRATALDYFLDNHTHKYSDYTADAYASIAFVPAIHNGERKLAKPLEVFSNPVWQSFGFPVLDPTLRQDIANKLKIQERPPTNQLVRLLERSPPVTQDQACEWFGILSRHIPGLCNARSHELGLRSIRLSRFRIGQIIRDTDRSYPQRFFEVRRPSAFTAKSMLFQKRV